MAAALPVTSCRMLTPGRLSTGAGQCAAGSSAGQRTIVDETDYTLGGQRIRVLVGVDGVIRQRIGADGLQRTTGVAGDHLDMAVEEHPVAWLWLVAVAECVPTLVSLRVLADRDDAQRRRVRADPDISPLVERPWVRGAAGHPALLADHLRSQLKCEARKGRAGCTMVGAVNAVALPDDGLHLGRCLALCHLEVVGGDIDDG
jgi:hypothetical protein